MRRVGPRHEISFVESKARGADKGGVGRGERRANSLTAPPNGGETRNTCRIPLISIATVRHLVKRIEIFQEQIVSMCGRAEYVGGPGTTQSDAWNVIVGLTKNARPPDKDVVTIDRPPLLRTPLPSSSSLLLSAAHAVIRCSVAGLALISFADRSSRGISWAIERN